MYVCVHIYIHYIYFFASIIHDVTIPYLRLEKPRHNSPPCTSFQNILPSMFGSRIGFQRVKKTRFHSMSIIQCKWMLDYFVKGNERWWDNNVVAMVSDTWSPWFKRILFRMKHVKLVLILLHNHIMKPVFTWTGKKKILGKCHYCQCYPWFGSKCLMYVKFQWKNQNLTYMLSWVTFFSRHLWFSMSGVRYRIRSPEGLLLAEVKY